MVLVCGSKITLCTFYITLEDTITNLVMFKDDFDEQILIN